MDARFLTISDSGFFVGTVALLNSLRLTGNDSELVVLDCGLMEDQRRRLEAGGAVLLDSPDPGRHPWFLKPFPATLRPAGVNVLIDSDMIVTSSLEPIVERAAEGEICVFPDHLSDIDRWFAEWHEVFALRAPLRRQPYVNSGFVAFSSEHWPAFAARWQELCSLSGDLTERPPAAGLVAQPDQDALNALLLSEIPDRSVHRLPAYEWDLRRVTVEDAASLTCISDGRRQPLLHAALSPKVWQDAGWRRVGMSAAYVRLLPRLLFSADLAVRLRPDEVPVWLRPGLVTRLVVRAASFYTKVPVALLRARRAPRRAVRELRRVRASARRRARPGPDA